MSDEKICAAYVAAFAEIEAATKSAVNPHFKSKYADLPAVIDAIKPHLANHKLGFMQCPRPSEGGVAIETILIHADGEKLSMGVLFVPANKHDAHGFGSALTYARRYALQTCFGLPTEDDDGNAAVTSAPKKLTKDEELRLRGLISSTDADEDELLKHYQVRSLSDLSPAKYKAVIAILEKRAAR
jgi:hypothetical protein